MLTTLLAPALTPGARVVALSSAAHQVSPVRFDDIHFERSAYDKWVAYGQSKTANALFAVALNRRLTPRGIEAFSVHPGMIRESPFRNRLHPPRRTLGIPPRPASCRSPGGNMRRG